MAKLFRVILAATAIVGLLFVNGIPNGMGQNTTTPLPSPTPTSTTPSANPTESTISNPHSFAFNPRVSNLDNSAVNSIEFSICNNP